MAETIYTKREIDQINLRKDAVPGAIYTDDKGNKFFGTTERTLSYIQPADRTPIADESGEFESTDVEGALLELSNRHTQIEVDFGEDALIEKVFTISDDRAVSGAIISATIAYDAPTGKDLDELEMDNIFVQAGNANGGSFDIFVKEIQDTPLYGKFKINYIIK